MNSASGSKRILLVDDDQAARESIKLLLSIDRHTVTEASSALEALQLFTGARYDLVITDYLMPEMLGDELAQNIKALEPKQQILMVTAYVEKLLTTGTPANAVLSKPLSVDELRRAMSGNGYDTQFTRAGLVSRAAARTDVVEDILQQGQSPRSAAN